MPRPLLLPVLGSGLVTTELYHRCLEIAYSGCISDVGRGVLGSIFGADGEITVTVITKSSPR